MTIHVVSPGAFTTVQDLGRHGWASAGVPPSGAMDLLALRAANLLAGNDEKAAGLEITMLGPALRFDEAAVVAVTGATFDADLDGNPVPRNESFRVPPGATLTLRKARRGARCYVGVRGGIDVPIVLGSRSTLASAGFGGVDGRALAARDLLRTGSGRDAPLRRMRPDPSPPTVQPVRVLAGPQPEAFTAGGRDGFFGTAFTVSPRSDRVGVRLEGEPLEHAGPAEIDPEGVVTGAIQIPGDGRPIVLGPDRPVTGGYAKIATVIAADLGRIAQARPGDTVRFVEVTLDEARAVQREREQALRDAIEDIA